MILSGSPSHHCTFPNILNGPRKTSSSTIIRSKTDINRSNYFLSKFRRGNNNPLPILYKTHNNSGVFDLRKDIQYLIEKIDLIKENNIDSLMLLINSLRDPSDLAFLSKDEVEKIINCVSSILVREIHDVEKVSLLSDTPYRAHDGTEFKALQVVYQFFLTILFKCKRDIVVDYISSKQASSYVSLLYAKGPDESNLVCSILINMLRICPGCHDAMYTELFKIFDNFLSGLRSYIGISGALRVLGVYVSLIGEWDRKYDNLFTYVILRLFSCNFLSEYYRQLSFVCQFFYKRSDKYAAEAINYLLHHWPLVSASKVVAFLTELYSITSSSNPHSYRELVSPMFMKIKESLVSDNVRVVSVALVLCGNSNFIYSYLPFPDGFNKDLMEHIENTKNHWSSDIRGLSEKILTCIKHVVPSTDKMHSGTSKASLFNRDEIWKDLSEKCNINAAEI